MNTRKNILITGASSILMHELIEKINETKFTIWAVTRDRTKISNPKTKLLEGNIRDPAFINSIILDNKIDIVIHAAAITHTSDTQEYFDVNLQSTINLVNASKQNNVQKFIFISTRAATMDSGAYGISKLKAEEFIKTNIDKWLIIRPSEIFGGNKKEGIDKLINDLFHKKIILCPMNLKSKLYPIFNSDAAQVIFNLIFDEHLDNKVLTINGKEGFSYYELIRRISKSLERKVFIIPIPRFIMFTIKRIVEVFRIRTGIVPDQISRLYSCKETELAFSTISIEEYVIAQKLMSENFTSKFV